MSKKNINNKLKFFLLVLFFILAIFYYNTKQVNIDLNGLWGNSENTSIIKIIQEGSNVKFTLYQLDPNWKWPGKVGDTTVEAVLNGNNLTGRIMIVPERGYCTGYFWWHDFTATVSRNGKTIDQVFKTNVYDKETCQETAEYPVKMKRLIKI